MESPQEKPMFLQLVDGFGKFYTFAEVVPTKYIFDRDLDICEMELLTGDISKIQELRLAKKSWVGQFVKIFGYPSGRHYNVTSGYIGSPISMTKSFVSAESSPGNSGSPVTNIDGEVLGILVAGIINEKNSNIIMNLWVLEAFLS
jgi:V8-like Glu-specific endopeptidase